MDCRRLQLGILGLMLSLMPGAALAGVVDQVQLARESILAGDLKAAVKALDAAQKSAPSEGAIVPPRLLAQLHFYRGVIEHKSGDKKGLALDAWRQALIVENGFEWEADLLAEDDPRSVFEALRAEVRSRPKVETWVPDKTGLARLYVDGKQRAAKDQVLEGLHLAQIECPDGAVYGLWTDLAKDPRWFKLCPGGVDTSVEPAVASTEEDEWGDFAPVFGGGDEPATEPATPASATPAPPTVDPARAKAEAEAKKKADAEAKKRADADAKAAQEAAAAKAAQEAAAAKAAQDAAAAKAAQDAAAAKAAQEAAAAKAAQDAAAAKAAQDAAAAKAAQDAAAAKAAQDAAAAKAAQDAAAAKAAAEDEARQKAEAEAIAAQAKAAEEAERMKAEEQARRKAEDEARKKAEEQAKAKAAEGGPRVLTRPTDPPKADEPVADADTSDKAEKPDKADKPDKPEKDRAIDQDAGMRSGKSKRGGPLGGILLGTGGAALAGATTYYFVSFAPNYADLQDARDNPIDRDGADELESRHDSRRYTVLGLGALGLAASAAGGVVIALDADLPVRAFVGWGSVGLGGRF